jgi:peptidoglycan/LPS O-acetylase OafA/YrhL
MQPMRTISPRLQELDLLRILAALSVVFFHYTFAGAGRLTKLEYPAVGSLFKYGYLGVEFFFMISGFVILLTAGSATLKSFAISRFTRIFPALWVCATLTFLCSQLFNDVHPELNLGLAAYASSLFLLNRLAGTALLDGSYWSLFYELQFYAMISAFMAIGQLRRYPVFLLVWLCLSVVVLVRPQGLITAIFMTDYSAFFIGGSLAYLIHRQNYSRWLNGAYLATGVVAVLQSLRRLDHMHYVYKGDVFDPAVIVCLIGAMFGSLYLIARGWTGWLGQRKWAMVGAITYPLYLIHQNIGLMVFNSLYPAYSAPSIVIGTITLMLGVALILHLWVEKPFSRWVGKTLKSKFS